jgi:iron-sulfur cluster assembly protein
VLIGDRALGRRETDADLLDNVRALPVTIAGPFTGRSTGYSPTQLNKRGRERAVLALTEQAKQVIKNIVEEVGPEGGLRIRAAGEENGDTALEFDLAPAPGEGDKVIEADGAKVFLDPAAAEVLADKTLDVHEHGDHFHFSLEDQTQDSAAS